MAQLGARVLRVLLLAAGGVGVALGGCGDTTKEQLQAAKVGQACTLNTDCKDPLVCAFQRCHEQCAASRDCPAGQRCVNDSSNKGVCLLPVETTCTHSTDCPGADQLCAEDLKCRDRCSVESNCLAGQKCTSTHVCADTTELDSKGNLPVLSQGGGAGDGGGGEAGRGVAGASGESSGGTKTSGGTGASGGTQSGGGSGGRQSNGGEAGTSDEGGSGGLPCQGALAGGGCSYCPRDACENGECISGDHDYECDCSPGFTGTGTKTCTLNDPCSANLSCPAAYPCAPIEIGSGTSCVGEFATWLMPDSQLQGSVKPSYSGDADTVTDNVTGLEWQRATPADCTPAGAEVDADAGAVSCGSLANAQAYCDALELGGKKDWRLPGKIELESLIDFLAPAPTIDAGAFPSTLSTTYWTNSPRAGSPDHAWIVDFSQSLSVTSLSTGDYGRTYAVRCVRGTGLRPSTAKDHYTVVAAEDGAAGAGSLASEGTVTDNWTGLTWEGTGTATVLSFDDAATYCAALGSGFRVPSEKELLTLVDPSRVGPAIDPNIFPGTQNVGYISSTGSSGGGGRSVHFLLGDPQGPVPSGLVRCVHR